MAKSPDSTALDLFAPTFAKTRMTLLSQTAGIGEWTLDLTTHTQIWSEFLYQFYELERHFDCASLLDATDFYTDADKKKLSQLIARVVSTKTAGSAEFAITMPDGRSKWHATTVHPVFDRNNGVSGLYGLVRDITENKQTAEKQRLYSQIFDKLPAALAVLDRTGSTVYVNQAALHTQTGQPVSTDRPSDTHAKPARAVAFQQCITQRKPVVFEEKQPGLNGSHRIVRVTLLPLIGDQDDNTHVIEYGTDITANKRYEVELQRMAYVAEKTNGIVMITDPERKIIWINNSFEKILGYRSEEVVGRNPAEFLQGPETAFETIREISRSLKNTGCFSGEILNYTKSGEKIWLYLNITAVYDDSGRLINYVAVENDITQIKLAEQQSQMAMEKERELNRFKTQFVNLASHQFRTPLAAIRSSIDVLDLKLDSIGNAPAFNAVFHKHKGIITEETIRMTELMENILDIGRMDEGKIELSKRAFSFKSFMDDFVQANSETGGQQRKLHYRFDAPDNTIHLDEILMRNVLRNIVSNAFKYSEGQPAPEITVSYARNTYFIQIKDYGIGIPEKDQPFLFQSFFRASNAKRFPGSGLGLMIAKKLILLHGGTISCESKTGGGCIVTIQCA